MHALPTQAHAHLRAPHIGYKGRKERGRIFAAGLLLLRCRCSTAMLPLLACHCGRCWPATAGLYVAASLYAAAAAGLLLWRCCCGAVAAAHVLLLALVGARGAGGTGGTAAAVGAAPLVLLVLPCRAAIFAGVHQCGALVAATGGCAEIRATACLSCRC